MPADVARRATIVSNPNARGAVPRADLESAAEPLRARGWEIEVQETRAAGEASDLARRAYEDGASVVVACGGDGTLNEVLNGLAVAQRRPGEPPAVALVPAGTANVWSVEAAIPSDPTEALALLEDGQRRPFDLGVASIEGERRRFALMCGVGLDAQVTEAVEHAPRVKRWLGKLAFVWPSLRALASARGVETAVTARGVREDFSAVQLIAGNTRLYGGLARITSGAVADDGLLDVAIFLDDGNWVTRPWRFLRTTLATVRGHLDRRYVRGIAYRRATLLEVRPERELAVQVDGEPIAHCGPESPLTLAVEPAAVTMITPPGPNPLFGA